MSSLDFANAITLEGFRVPAISTRRTQTEVELQDGQTFAIAGLMNNTITSQMSKIPGIGDIPILGYLFRSKAAQKNQTELVVMITPQILRRGSTGVSPKLPDLVEPYMPPATKTLPSPAPWNPGAPAAGRGRAAGRRRRSPPLRASRARACRAPAVAHVARAGSGSAVGQALEGPEAGGRARDEGRGEAARAGRQAGRGRPQEGGGDGQGRRQARRRGSPQGGEGAKEQAKLQAEIDRRTAEAAKRQAELDKKDAEQRAIAQAKLDAARQQYEQQVAKIQAENGQPK